MHWYYYLAYFFGGAFLGNSVPHLGNGVSGRAFQSPFASPPGVGTSSSVVNVLWGFFNLAIAYLLICRVGSFDLRLTQDALALGAGILAMSLFAAHAFGRFHGGNKPV
jgi:ABC-type tungstate transport system substrate-binding protein